MKTPALILLATLSLLFLSPEKLSAHELRAEAGLFTTGYNKFAIPNPAGTRVTFTNSETGLYYRGQATFQIGERSFLRLMAAPLEANYTFAPATPIQYNNTTFPAGTPTEVQFQFNSYRASYLYRFPLSESFLAQIGGVAKIRVAKIALRSAGTKSEYNNTGFVPLLNLGLTWVASPIWELRFDLDAAAAKQGRAEDGSLELFYRLSEKGSGVSAGYRILEGGADNEKVYTFSLFHYAFAALTYGF